MNSDPMGELCAWEIKLVGLGVGLLGVIAAFNLSWLLCLQFGTSFNRIVEVLPFLLVLGAALCIWYCRLLRIERRAPHRSVQVTLIACSMVAGFFALLVIRPDFDDGFYVSKALRYFENPAQTVDLVDWDLAPSSIPYHAYLTSTSAPVDYLWAALSLLFGMNYLTLYYEYLPILAGILSVNVWYVVVRLFGFSSRESIVALIAIHLGLLVLGDTHRSWGNFSLVRIWQGKSIFLSLVLPLYSALLFVSLQSAHHRSLT